VLLNLTSCQISLHELLTSPMIRFWAMVSSENGRESTKRVFYRPPGTTLKEVLIDLLGDLDLAALTKWSISLCPSPKLLPEPLNARDLEKSLSDVGIVFGSVLTLARRNPSRKKKARVQVMSSGM